MEARSQLRVRTEPFFRDGVAGPFFVGTPFHPSLRALLLRDRGRFRGASLNTFQQRQVFPIDGPEFVVAALRELIDQCGVLGIGLGPLPLFSSSRIAETFRSLRLDVGEGPVALGDDFGVAFFKLLLRRGSSFLRSWSSAYGKFSVQRRPAAPRDKSGRFWNGPCRA